MRFLPLFIALLLAAPAAADWLQNCQANRVITVVRSDGFACFEPSSNTESSPIISVVGLEHTSWSYFKDKDGDATDCAVEFTIQKCPAANLTGSAADNGCEDVNVTNPTLSSTNTGVGGIVVGSPYMRVKAGGSGANAGDCRIMVMGSR